MILRCLYSIGLGLGIAFGWVLSSISIFLSRTTMLEDVNDGNVLMEPLHCQWSQPLQIRCRPWRQWVRKARSVRLMAWSILKSMVYCKHLSSRLLDLLDRPKSPSMDSKVWIYSAVQSEETRNAIAITCGPAEFDYPGTSLAHLGILITLGLA